MRRLALTNIKTKIHINYTGWMLQKQVTWSILGNTSFQSGLGIDREIKERILLELSDNQVKKKRRHTPGSRNSICKGPAAPRSRHRHNQGGGSRGKGSRRQHRMRSRTHPIRVVQIPWQNFVFILRVVGGQQRDLTLVNRWVGYDHICILKGSLRLLNGGQTGGGPIYNKCPTLFTGFPLYAKMRRSLQNAQSNSSNTRKITGTSGVHRKRAQTANGTDPQYPQGWPSGPGSEPQVHPPGNLQMVYSSICFALAMFHRYCFKIPIISVSELAD